MRRLLACHSLVLLLACGSSEENSTAEASPSQGGSAGATASPGTAGGSSASAGGTAAGAGGSAAQGGASAAGAGGSAAGAQGGAGPAGSAGASFAGAAGSAGGTQETICQGFQMNGPEIGLPAASDLNGVGSFDLARIGGNSVFVLALSEVDAQQSLAFGQAASFAAAPWPASDVGPLKKLGDAIPLYDAALVPATDTAAVALLLTITNSGAFPIRSLDPGTLASTELASFFVGADAMSAAFVAQRPGGFVGGASIPSVLGGQMGHTTFALLASQDGQSTIGKIPLACARGARPLVSAFHRDGETVVVAASESSSCQGDTPSVRLFTLADDDDTLTPQLKTQLPAPDGDLYETVLAADAGAGATWVVSRQLGLTAEVQPPSEVRRILPDGSEAVRFELPGEQLITRTMAVASLSGNLLVALPDASIEGQGTVVVRLYTPSGKLAGETAVGTPLSAGGPYGFIDRVRLLPLDGMSFAVAYQARSAPGQPGTLRLARVSCFGPD